MNEMQSFEQRNATVAYPSPAAAAAPSPAGGGNSALPGAVRTLEVIGAEIRQRDQIMIQHACFMAYEAIEIGRLLAEARDQAKHGEWMSFLKEHTRYSYDKANDLIRIFETFGEKQKSLFGVELSNLDTYQNFSVSKLKLLCAIASDEEREAFVKEVGAEHLSTRELEAAIRERDEARRELEASEKLRAEMSDRFAGDREELKAAREEIGRLERAVEDAGPYRERAEAAEARVKELESRPIDVAVQEPDPDEVERRAKELANKAIEAAAEDEKRQRDAFKAAADAAEARARQTEEKARAERDRLREKLKAAEEKAAAAEKRAVEDAGPYKAEAEQARAEAEELRRKLAMSGGELVAFKLRFEAWQKAYQAMREALERLPEEQREKCGAAVKAQIAGWSS